MLSQGSMKPRTRPSSTPAPARLSDEGLAYGVRFLARRDPDLARSLKDFGPPPMWPRKPGFATLLYIILEQQVSLASAKAAYQRLRQAASPLTPARFLKLDDAALKAIGFSRQKTGYGRHLAQAILARRLDLAALETLDDEAARLALTAMRGIGPWTADIYLLMALRRPDIWPSHDLALALSVQRVKRLKSRPIPDELDRIGAAWKPWRAVAARMLWHDYLGRRA